MTACSATSRPCSTTPTRGCSGGRSTPSVPSGPPGRKALPVVIGKLDSTDPEVRLAAAELIGSHGQAAAEAVPALTALLDDPTPKIRTIAAQTLGKLGKAAQPAFARLTSLLGAEQAEVREAAVIDAGKPGARRRSHPAPSRQGAPGRQARSAPRRHEGDPAARPPGGHLRPGHHPAGREARRISGRSSDCCAGSSARARTRGRSRSSSSSSTTSRTPSACWRSSSWDSPAGVPGMRSPPSSGCAKIPAPRSASRRRPPASRSRSSRRITGSCDQEADQGNQ